MVCIPLGAQLIATFTRKPGWNAKDGAQLIATFSSLLRGANDQRRESYAAVEYHRPCGGEDVGGRSLCNRPSKIRQPNAF